MRARKKWFSFDECIHPNMVTPLTSTSSITRERKASHNNSEFVINSACVEIFPNSPNHLSVYFRAICGYSALHAILIESPAVCVFSPPFSI